MKNADAFQQLAKNRLKAVVITPNNCGIAYIFFGGRAEVQDFAHRRP
jgi:hypothetical protein